VRRARLLARVLVACAALGVSGTAGCGGSSPTAAAPTDETVHGTARTAAAARLRPVPAGRGPGFDLAAHGLRVARSLPVDELRCRAAVGRRVEAHLELFARGRVIPIPPGIGIAPPLQRGGAYVHGGRCSYAVRTREPTGLLELRAGAVPTLGQLFDVWGQPLSRTRLAAFHGSVRAYVGGVRWHGDPRAIPLRRHAAIALAVGPAVPRHATYVFPRRD
jgi:hypothetical protein